MSWLTLIALSTIAHSTAVLFQRILVQENKQHPIAFIVIFQTIVGIIVLLYGWIGGYLTITQETVMSLWPWIVLACLLYAGANYCIFASLERIQASKFTVAFSSRMFFTSLAAWLLLNEKLSGLQLIGALLIFIGIIIANFTRKTQTDTKNGLLFAIIAAGFFGLANVNDRYILQTMELYTYVGISFIGTAIVFAIFQSKKLLSGVSLLQLRSLNRISLLSVFYAISSVTFFAALQIGNSASQVVSVSLVSVIVTVLFAMIFLKERDNAVSKIIGALCAFAGVLLLV